MGAGQKDTGASMKGLTVAKTRTTGTSTLRLQPQHKITRHESTLTEINNCIKKLGENGQISLTNISK